MTDLNSLIADAEKRYYNRNIDLPSVLKKIAALKKKNAGELPEEPEEEDTGLPKPPGRADILKERTLGSSDFLPVNYLERGLTAARTVGRIIIRNSIGDVKGYGTGFLVSPGLLLTNSHVIDDRDEAANHHVEFDYEKSLRGEMKPCFRFRFEPDQYFISSLPDELDFTLIAVAVQDESGHTPLSDFGFMPLLKKQNKLKAGECLSIIQHPAGEHKQIAIRENKLIDADDVFIRYQTDTAPGSSGSMVTNDQWEVVALHHSGVPKRDKQNRILARNGKPWDEETMSDDKIDWVANEGVKINRIIDAVLAEQKKKKGWGREFKCY